MKITVEGITGEGKTTLGVHLARVLRKEGFEVEFSDIDGPEHVVGQRVEEKMASLRERGLKIEVATKQQPRK